MNQINKNKIEFLTNFQLHLYEIGLIGDCAWDFEKQAKRYVKYLKNEGFAKYNKKILNDDK